MLTPAAIGILLASVVASAAGSDVLHFETTPNGFNAPPRGWNSFGLQALSPPLNFEQESVISQCDALADNLGKYGYEYCSLDSGWSIGDHGDENGRIDYDSSKFDIPALANHLHGKKLKLGVYILPGYFSKDKDKQIYGTNPPVKLSDVGTGECDGLARCAFDYTKPAAQKYCNSVVDQFASWGVDFIKLDFITPGSPDNNAGLPADSSGSVICYHKAIAQNGRKMRLDISWKLERNDTYYSIWKNNLLKFENSADSMRVDQDINNSNQPTLTSWKTVQRTIEQYRQYISLQVPKGQPLTIYPDMDNLFVGNKASLTGLSDGQRQTVMTHWIGAAANLILGSDMTKLDSLGLSLLTNTRAQDVAKFTASYPMRPLEGNNNNMKGSPKQIWIAGPDPTTGVAVIVLANYGASGDNSLFDPAPAGGKQELKFALKDFGLSQDSYCVKDTWNPKNDRNVTCTETISVSLDDGESRLWKVVPQTGRNAGGNTTNTWSRTGSIKPTASPL
ncbi:hypothetical protein GP486_005942 [Trichoglossum hirsutum]|uniref:alpha-galactosidase n=1 Tax=Trichoglossum hirsutum TaxID=265104 RepID=A0A9P8L8A7_9PEZI|nr:hypothetical protein GP486_005942 [Trichoglossum hirsutum]